LLKGCVYEQIFAPHFERGTAERLGSAEPEAGYAYPLLSIGYIVTALAGWHFFDEAMDCTRWSGIAVICGGVWLITRTV